MSLMRIAFRNLERARARTALSLVAIAAGVFAVILTKGAIDGILDMMVGNSIRLSSGHVRVVAREYLLKERLLSLNYPADGFQGEGYESVVPRQGVHDIFDVLFKVQFGHHCLRVCRRNSGDAGRGLLAQRPGCQD